MIVTMLYRDFIYQNYNKYKKESGQDWPTLNDLIFPRKA